MNKTYLIFRHEFVETIKRAGYIIMTLIVPVTALAGIGIFKLAMSWVGAPTAAPAGPIDSEVATLAGAILPGVFSLLLALALMLGATSLVRGLAEEKESRLIEVLLSSVSVRQLLMGKVLARGAAGLLQVLVWLISMPFILDLASASFGGIIGYISVPVNFLLLGVAYFVLGYLLFAVLSIGLGAISTNSQEGSTLSLVYTLTSFIPLWLFALLLFFPESPLWVVLTIFPVTAPVQVMVRLGVGTIPFWQIVVSIGVLMVSIAVGMILAIRIFRLHMLMAGLRPKLGEIVKGTREA